MIESWTRKALVAACIAVLMATPALADDIAPAQSGGHQYVGAAKCKSCHKKELMGDQYGVWMENVHKGAFDTLLDPRSVEIAANLGLDPAPHESLQCLICHSTASRVSPDRAEFVLAAEDGVQCESCHGPGSEYRKKKIMSDREQSTAKGLWDAEHDAEICVQCHNPESPTYDPTRYTLEDGTTTGFAFHQAVKRIVHPIPEEVKGKYLEIEARLKKERREARDGG